MSTIVVGLVPLLFLGVGLSVREYHKRARLLVVCIIVVLITALLVLK